MDDGPASDGEDEDAREDEGNDDPCAVDNDYEMAWDEEEDEYVPETSDEPPVELDSSDEEVRPGRAAGAAAPASVPPLPPPRALTSSTLPSAPSQSAFLTLPSNESYKEEASPEEVDELAALMSRIEFLKSAREREFFGCT
jgi:hypothetical protein